MPGELKSNAAITDMQMSARDVAALRCKIHEVSLADAKAEMMLCVMMRCCAGRRRLHIKAQSVSQCVATTASGVDNAALPDWQTNR